MRVIVDTNIIFSTLLNSSSNIADLIFNSDSVFEFYSCGYMQREIEKHWEKLKKLSELSDSELQTSYHKTLLKIRFINEEFIPQETWVKAEEILGDIDIDDVDFLAMTEHLQGNLWTGDKRLYKGLKGAGFQKVYNTKELLELRKQN